MKNLNKLALGILVGALAIGFSAFKSTTVQVRYFKTTGSLLSTSASDRWSHCSGRLSWNDDGYYFSCDTA